ncbi:DinB family protein [bacterium]|nr:DinB family protein [bacterium]
MDKNFYLKRWPVIRQGTMEIVNGLQPEDLTVVPVEGGWNVGGIVLHIGSAAEYWLHSGRLTGERTAPEGERTLEVYPTLDAIKTYLADEHGRTLTLLRDFDMAVWEEPITYDDGRGYPPSWIFWHVLEHEIHHRGELSLIAGLLSRHGLDV